MARVSYLQPAFVAGELSPRLDGRVDIAKYGLGCKTLQNFIPFAHGGVTRRPGTVFVAEVKDSSKAVRLIAFQFSVTQAYIIEFGHAYCRFYMDNGRISTGGSPVEISTPYDETDLFELEFAQSADTLYIAHPDYAPRKLTRSSHLSWTLATISFSDGPYLAANTSGITLTPSATSGSGITITASSAVFASTDVGRLVRIQHSATWGNATITAFTSSTQVTATVNGTFGATTASSTWRLGHFSPTTGYPRAVSFFEERLWWGGTNSYPQTLFGSKSGDFENMAPSSTAGVIADDSAVVYTLAADEVNVIRHLVATKVLTVLTVGGEFVARSASTNNAPITPTNIQVVREATYGSNTVKARVVGGSVLFVQRSGKKLRELIYDLNTDGYVAGDMTLLAEHITGSGIVDMTWQQEPDQVVWAVRVDGTLLSCTFDKSQNVVAWATHVLGGSTVDVESVASIPTASGDQLWLAISRVIDGSLKRYIEYMAPTDFGSDVTDAFFVDAGLSYDGAATTTLSGLDHLEGETVQVLGNGAVRADAVVSGGSITLSSSVTKASVGLGYTSTLKSMRIEAGSQAGSAQGSPKRIHALIVRFYETLGGKVGPDAANLDTIYYRSSADAMDEAPALFSGDKEVRFPSGWDTDGFFMVEQTQPLPMTVLCVMPRITTIDR